MFFSDVCLFFNFKPKNSYYTSIDLLLIALAASFRSHNASIKPLSPGLIYHGREEAQTPRRRGRIKL